jgi:2-keto-myo-inositol isomerase
MLVMGKMMPCINQATVLPTDTLEFIVKAKEVGFRLVELDIAKLEDAVQRYGLPKLKETIKGREMKIISLNAIENYPILARNDMMESLARCERIFKLSRDLECQIVVVNPNEFESGNGSEMQEAFDSLITRAAEIASKFSVRLGYEFVAYENRIINTLAESLNGLSRWSSDIGLVLDVFHLFRTGESITQIPDRLMNRVWIFHVNDAPQMPLSALKDSDRVFPGEGVVNVKEALAELESKGFAGPVSLELFNANYWKRPTTVILKRSWDNLESLLGF